MNLIGKDEHVELMYKENAEIIKAFWILTIIKIDLLFFYGSSLRIFYSIYNNM